MCTGQQNAHRHLCGDTTAPKSQQAFTRNWNHLRLFLLLNCIIPYPFICFCWFTIPPYLFLTMTARMEPDQYLTFQRKCFYYYHHHHHPWLLIVFFPVSGPLTQLVTEKLLIHNDNDAPLAFKVKTTAPRQYCVRPNAGLIEAQSHQEVKSKSRAR